MCDLLTEQYKPCEKLVSFKGDVARLEKKLDINTRIPNAGDVASQLRFDQRPLYSRYKFVLAMNNALWEGYSTEKEVYPFVAQSIAIVGTPDYAQMANANRIVHCNIPLDVLKYAGQWNTRHNSFMPFNTTPEDWKNDPTIQPIPFDLKNDGDLMQFAKEKFRTALQPCIKEIIRLDQDDEAYIQKLMEPYILQYENSLFDGTYVATGILQWLEAMGSSVMTGIDPYSLSRVRIDEQTVNTKRK